MPDMPDRLDLFDTSYTTGQVIDVDGGPSAIA
jgi:hypothetical protein